ncbi:HAD family hydrolase [Mycolicibacter sinensis]|uniref:HAD family hydrolase n=1 Tax=Mycolicibacter sinensis (strain JDM601) TaxID=875328 RepID=UPI001930CBDB|nr:HAD family phosphatase [Mycolicibacter sinensis]
MPTLLIDYGGVLTSSVPAAFANVCARFGVDLNGFMAACRMGHPDGPFAQLELGLDDVEFARVITPILTEHANDPVDGLAWVRELQKTSLDIDKTMLAAVADLIDNGVPTVLFSNSFGPLERYPWAQLPTFTDTVISSVVGMRKPDPRIYEIALQRCGRPAHECVFVDDSEANLAPARALGIRSIHHQDPATTIAELNAIFG